MLYKPQVNVGPMVVDDQHQRKSMAFEEEIFNYGSFAYKLWDVGFICVCACVCAYTCVCADFLCIHIFMSQCLHVFYPF